MYTPRIERRSTMPNSSLALKRAEFSHFVTQQLTKEPLSDEADIGTLQEKIAVAFGYLFLDWGRPSRRWVDYIEIDIRRKYCYAHRLPLIVLFCGRSCCTLQIDMDPAQRDLAENSGGMTPEEVAAVDALVREAGGKRVWGDSPVLRRFERLPYANAHSAAWRTFRVITEPV
jgi:hypothetical protein